MMTVTPVLSVKANDTIWIGSTVSRMLNVLSVTEKRIVLLFRLSILVALVSLVFLVILK